MNSIFFGNSTQEEVQAALLQQKREKYAALLTHGIKSVYLSNKMRGLPNHGFDWFDTTRPALQSLGIHVYCPVELDRVLPIKHPDPFGDEAWRLYMQRDIELLMHCKPEAILLGPQWRDSPGANIEAALAPVIDAKVFAEDQQRVVESWGCTKFYTYDGIQQIHLSRRLF